MTYKTFTPEILLKSHNKHLGLLAGQKILPTKTIGQTNLMQSIQPPLNHNYKINFPDN